MGIAMSDAPLISKRTSRSWVWFFAVLAVLAVLAVGTLIAYNAGQQLKPEQLAAARALWKEKGPADYNLEYSIQKQESELEHWAVEVRGGKVVAVALNDRPLE